MTTGNSSASGLAGQDGRETRLLEMIRRRQSGAFELLVATHQEAVARLAYRLLGWSDEAEDVVQEVFLAALMHLDDFRGQSSVSTWLTRITLNACRGHLRRRWLREKFRLASRRAGTGKAWGRIAAPGLSPPNAALEGERLAQVRAAVQSLPARLREVVVLRYLEERPIEEIRQVLGLSETALHQRLYRARELLREKLKDLSWET